MIRQPAYEYRAVLSRVVDGDTLYLQVDLGFCVFVMIDVRLARIDAPERDTDAGTAATAYLQQLVTGHDLLLRSKGKDRYGRWIGEVRVERGWVSDLMIEAGHAKPFK